MINSNAFLRSAWLEAFPDALRIPLITSIAYFLGAQAAFLIGTLSDAIFAPFWPPNMILFYALLRTDYADWWKLLLAVLPAHVIAELQVGMDWPQLTVAFLTNCAVALINAWGVRWLLVSPPWLSSFRRALIFVIVAAGIGPALVAFFGAYVRIYGGGPVGDYWTYWMQWYVSNALGNLTLTPLFLAFCSTSSGARTRAWLPIPWTESAITLAALYFSCFIAIKGSMLWGGLNLWPTLLYLPLPFIFWATVRFAVRGASLAVLTLTLTTIWSNLSGPTVFAASTPEENVLALQLFLTGIAIPVLLLGAYIDCANKNAHRSRELSRKVLHSKEESQRKTAGELHEGVCQDLTAALLRARYLFKSLPPDAASEAAAIEEDILKAVRTLRATAYGMYPPLLAEEGLEPAIRSFVHAYSERSGIAVSLDVAGDIGRRSADVENVAFRIVEEALTNVAQHSVSTRARVTLSRSEVADDQLYLRIEDPAPDAPRRVNVLSWLRSLAPTSSAGGFGIPAITERVHAIGGSLRIRTTGSSTVLEATFPGAPVEPVRSSTATVRQACGEPHTAPAPL